MAAVERTIALSPVVPTRDGTYRSVIPFACYVRGLSTGAWGWMMPFEDIAFQLVDLPPISSEHVEPWVFDLVRRADLVWLVVGGENALDQLQETRALLEAKKIGTWPAGVSAPSPEEPGKVWKKSMLVVGGADRPGVLEDLPALEELLDSGWRPLAVSSVNGHGLEELKRRTFEAAEIVRVYTKQPGKPPNRDAPFTLPRGSTVGGLAERDRTLSSLPMVRCLIKRPICGGSEREV